MPLYQKEVSNDRREMIRAYASMATDRLRLILSELHDKLHENIHLETETEVGRSSNSLLMNNVNVAINAVMYVLNRRGELSEVERREYLMSLPKTSYRMVLNPFRGNNL